MSQQTYLFEYEKGALFSRNGKYRWNLYRIWDVSKPKVLFIMHNPSTADAKQDDPTIRRCINFARQWGYGGIWVGNIYPYRSTDPKALLRINIHEAMPRENQDHIQYMIKRTELHILAYGVPVLKERICLPNVKWHYLKLTKDGNPCHPLYLKKDLVPVLFDQKGGDEL